MAIAQPEIQPAVLKEGPEMRLALLGLLVLPMPVFAADPKPVEPTPSLEEAYRALHKGLSSSKKEDREKALRSVFLDKKAVERLFPKQAEKLWPKIEEGNREMLKVVDEIAKEATGGGAIKNFKAEDVRKNKSKAEGAFKRVLAILPNDVPVFDYVVYQESKVAGGFPFVFVNGRWVWFPGLEKVPDALDELK